ncbi:MAG: DNA repair protein RecN, partial [Acidobacteriales bacterium]|nr:DNA repair protein RecN [Terriglobales bacterium]
MLTHLRVENYAVIDQLDVEFGAGLNLLTGETGAGKSILIDALSLLLGEKASSDMVRHGMEKATVSAAFSVQGRAAKALSQVLSENGIDAEDPEQLIVRREVSVSGKGRVFVNNQPATVGVLRQIAPHAAFIHAQNETLAHFDGEERRKLLDSFAGVETARCAELFASWSGLKQRIDELQRDEQERLRQVDLWRFQHGEIEAAQLVAGEDERLETERRVLQNSERLFAAANSAFNVLYEEDHSAAATVRTAAKHIEELSKFDGRFGEALQSITSAKALIEDVAATCRDYADAIDASPERLGQLEDGLAAIHLLKRKYGQTIDEVIAYGAQLGQRLAEIDNRDEVLAKLHKEVALAASAYEAEARKLSESRKEAAKKLATLVERNVNELAMKTKFAVEVRDEEGEQGWTASGWDSVTFLIATNVGEPMKPVEQIASGGEMSRVMLALKVSVFERNKAGG